MNGHQEKALEYLENLRSDISENFLVLAKMLARHLEVLLDTGIDQEDQVCLADSEITDFLISNYIKSKLEFIF